MASLYIITNTGDCMKYRTALFIIVNKSVQSLAGPLRAKYWPDSHSRIPAHISIFSPFVKFEELEKASIILDQICKSISPFDIELNGYGEFPGYIFMKLVDTGSTQDLYSKILAKFPECLPYEGKYGSDIHPHLSIGKFENESDKKLAKLPSYGPIAFNVDTLHLMYTNEEMTLPWKLYKTIKLGQ